MHLAPIALSTYSRLSHLKQTVEGLKANPLAKESELYLLSDGARPGDEKKVDAVRQYACTISGFKNLHIIERKENSRIKNNRNGIAQLLEKFGKCIYLEEDIVTAPGFLTFMNQALDCYQDNAKIFSISGYAPPINIPSDYRHDTFVLRRASAWGMGLWHDRYGKIRYLDHAAVLKKFTVYKEVEALTKYGEDLFKMVLDDAAGKIDALDVKIFFHQYVNDEFTIYPRKSLVKNIGFDGSGVHCGHTNRFDVELWDRLTFDMKDPVGLNEDIIASNFEFRSIGKRKESTETISTTNSETISKSDNLGENLIFLISQPRAGSTMLQRVLGSHSEIDTTSEPWIMLHPLFAMKQQMTAPFESQYAKTALTDFISHFPEKDELFYEAVRNYALTYYNRSLQFSKKGFFLDKTPRYYMIMPELLRCFPKSKYIILFRNPMAVLSSMLLSWFGNDPTRLIPDRNYNDLVEAPQKLLEGIKRLGGNAYVAHYEKLVSDTDTEFRRLCQWLNIDFEPDMTRYGNKKFNDGRLGDKIGVLRHTQPVRSALDQWKLHLTDHRINPFARKVLKIIGPEVFHKMGYDPSDILRVLNPTDGMSGQIRNGYRTSKENDVSIMTPEEPRGEKNGLDVKTRLANQASERLSRKIETKSDDIAVEMKPEGERRGKRGPCDVSALPRISVVTPSFNQGAYLEACIQSILQQDYPDIEYIIMDGGSTDGSKAIIEKYADKLAYWQSEPDKGQYWAIDEGFKRCTGDIMTWLNADDIFDPGAFTIAVAIFMQRSEIEWITGRRASVDASGDKLEIDGQGPVTWSRHKLLVEKAYHHPFIQQEGTFWTRNLWERSGAGLDTQLSLAGDLELWARFFRYARLYSIDYGLAFYRSHGENRALKLMDRYMAEAEKVIERETDIFRDENNSTPIEAPSPVSKQQIAMYVSAMEPIVKRADNSSSSKSLVTTAASKPTQRTVAGESRTGVIGSQRPMVTSRLIPIKNEAIDNCLTLGKRNTEKNSNSTITIILPTKNSANGLKETLESLSDAMQDISSEIILYADKESDDVSNCLKKYNIRKVFYDHQVFEEGESFSWSKMMNHGFAHASGGWIMYGSDDIVFYPGCFKNAISLLEKRSDEKIGGVTFLHRNTAETYNGFFTYFGYDTLNGDKPFINFGLIKADVFKKTNGFDQEFGFFWADTDICMQMFDNGYTIVASTGSLVDHNNILETKQKQQRIALFEKDTDYFFKKWHGAGLFNGKRPLDKVRYFVGEREGQKITQALQCMYAKKEKTTGRRRLKVVIDGVIFQLQARKPMGISRVWKNLIPQLERMMPDADITLLKRKGFDLPFVNENIITVPRYRLGNAATLDGDDELLMRTCQELGADLFISTYYTRAPGVSNVVMMHDLIPEKFNFDLSQPEWISKRRSIETADAFICVSRTTQQDLIEIYPQTANRPMVVAHNGLEGNFKAPSSDRVIRFRHELGLDTPYLLLVGNRQGYKNGIAALNSLAQIEDRDRPAVLCVGGEHHLSIEEKRLRERLDIRYAGYLDDHDLAAAYGGALALLVPSRHEGFGLPVIEAMACGCPVIAYASTAVLESGAEAICYVDVNSADDLHKALKMMSRKSHRQAYIQKGYDRVTRFDWSSTTKSIVDFVATQAAQPSILLTAIVSTYNAAQFIRGCLEDLENQTIADRMEIIVVDSASQQDEAAIVRDFQVRHSNIKYIRTPVRESVYQAWNRGIKIASGKYVTNANTDDRHRRDAYEVMVGTLEDNEDIALVYADVIKTRTANETFQQCTPAGMFHWYDWDRSTLLEKGCFIGPQPVWRRSVHREYGYFDENYEVSADFEFWLRISQTNEFYHISKPLGLYMDRPDSVEHANAPKKQQEDQEILDRYRRAAREKRVIGRSRESETGLNSEGRRIRLDCATTTNESIQGTKSASDDINQGGHAMHSPEELFSAIKYLVDNGQKESALWTMAKLLEEFPDNARLHNETAVLAYEQADMQKALRHFKQAVALDPQNTIYIKNLGDYYYAQEKDTQSALAQYESVLNLDPHHIDSLIMAGHLSISLHRYSQGQIYYQRVLEIDPQNAEIKQILEKMNPPGQDQSTAAMSVDDLYTAAIEKAHAGERETAISLLEQVLAGDAHHALAHNDLGVLQYEGGNLQGAMGHYEKAAELQPENETFQKNLADFYLAAMGDPDRAMRSYVQVLKLNPYDVQALLSCSQICMGLGKIHDARDFINAALDTDPGNENARQMLRHLDQPLHTVEASGPDLYEQAKSKAAEGDLDGAIQDINRYVTVEPDNANAHNDLGVLCFETGDKDKALASYKQAVQLQPDDPTYLKNLADFYLVEQGRMEDAMKLYLKVLEENPRDIESLLAGGLVCASLGNVEDAKVFYNCVLEIEPWNEMAQSALKDLTSHGHGHQKEHAQSAAAG